ncbi:MAG: hypothetical protein JXA93_05110 [Anaerolineae bacterium]|nr:hypothetical protein [Anaerolineae bacterium]
MTAGPPESIELTPDGASAFLHDELALAADSYAAGDIDAALDAHVRALGLALQLGPAACEQAIGAVLESARQMTPDTLAALGPALVQLHNQIYEAAALPGTPVMQSWASVVAYVGMLIGLAGVAGNLSAADRQGLVSNVRAGATRLDAETEHLFNFAGWVDSVVGGW